jgi:two-component system response regulator NreC
MSQIRVLVADDHVALRESLTLFIDNQPDMQVVGQASDGQEAVERALELLPDVLLIDLTMPRCNGITAIEILQEKCPEVRALILTMHDDQSFLRAALAAGAVGYVTKDVASKELLEAVREVAHGHSYLRVSLSSHSLKELVSDVAEHKSMMEALSERELEVLRLVARGHTRKQIADELQIGLGTVGTYRTRVFEKLGIKHRHELFSYAQRNGLLADP